MPSSIRKALNELPITLDDTYERMLQGIPKEKFEHAGRLFQCMVAAVRPLRVEELAEIFAIDFGPNAAPILVEGWRPEILQRRSSPHVPPLSRSLMTRIRELYNFRTFRSKNS